MSLLRLGNGSAENAWRDAVLDCLPDGFTSADMQSLVAQTLLEERSRADLHILVAENRV